MPYGKVALLGDLQEAPTAGTCGRTASGADCAVSSEGCQEAAPGGAASHTFPQQGGTQGRQGCSVPVPAARQVFIVSCQALMRGCPPCLGPPYSLACTRGGAAPLAPPAARGAQCMYEEVLQPCWDGCWVSQLLRHLAVSPTVPHISLPVSQEGLCYGAVGLWNRRGSRVGCSALDMAHRHFLFNL